MFKKERKKRIRPADDATSYIQSATDKPGLIERFIDRTKGRGVFATQPIDQDAFVLEYRGELLSLEECHSRHYSETQSTFLFEFEWQKRNWCVDASKEDGSLGRLVNDNHMSPNCTMKKIIVNGRPHLCIFAARKIEVGTEIDYNYGDSKWPWRNKGADELAPAVAVEAFTTSVTSYDSSNRDDVTDELAPAVAVETFITNVTSNENSNTDQGADELAPAVAVEAFTTSVTSYDSSNRDDVTDELAPAVAVETFITNVTSNENSNTDQVVTGRRLFLVDYSDTDQSDEDCLKYQPLTPHYDEHGCILKEENILLVGVPDFPDLVHHSNESIVEETEDEDSKKEHSNTVQSDNEDVPKLRRTKSILMDRVTDFSVGLYDSSDDSSEGPSTSNADMVSQRQRRCCRPIQMSLVGLDDSSADSGEEFIPNFKEESTDSDCSLELSLENTSQSRRKMSSQGRTKSSKQSRRKMSSQGRTESSKQSRRKMSSQGRTKSSKQSSSEFSSQGRTKSSKQSRRKMSSQGRTKSSKQSSSEFSSQGRTKSSQQSSSEFSSQGRTKSSQQSSSEFSSQGRTKSSKQSSSEFSSQGRTKSSQQSSSEFSSQGRTKSSKQSRSEFSSQGRTKSSKQSRSEFSSQSRTTSSSQSQFESSQNRSFETGQDFTQGFPQSSGDVNEEEMVQMYTDQKLSVSEPLVNKASVYVSAVLKKDDGSRRYNKKHHCLYCGQIVQKMSRHLFRKHGDEVDVAKALSFPKNSKQRHLQLEYIRKKGNYEHNTEVLESKKGKLIPCKQPNKKTDGQQFMHCIHCYGLFTRRVMWRHFQVCKFKPEGKTSKPGKTRVQAMCAFAEPAPVGLSDAYWKFINYMNQDKIAIAVKQDPCILEYGYRLFKKNERVVTQHQYIRQKLRELGRLVLAAKNVTPVNTIKELIKPEKYTHVVTAARCLAGYNEETGKYQRPSLARKVGHTLHSLAMYVKSEGLKMKDKETAQNAEEFTQLYQESWKYDIASEALTQLDQSKWNAPQLLPFTQDVQSLHSHLSEKQEQHLNALKGEVSPSNWKDLAKVTLAQVILFNRRREGEVSRMSLSAYLSKDASETHEDVNLALTALEQKLCKHFVRLTIVGKRGRKVPVLLTPLMRESLDTLIQKREECGVLNENGFLFALPHSVHYLRGSDCIRQFVHECDGIKNPKALTSTKLRKHIATLSTVLNLKTTELDQLADFLGHNIDVHRKHYRLPEGTLQLAKISKVLLAMEQGRLGEYKGKSLDEIHIDLNETVDMEGCSQEDMEGCSQEDMEDCSQEDMEDASMPVEQGSEDEVSVASSRGKQRKSAKKRGTVDIEGCSQENMEDASMPVEQGSEDEVSVASLEECTSTVHVQRKSAGKRGKEATVKRSWTPEECAAVGRHLRKFIVIHQVPGKIDCESCIAAEPEALGNRDWKSVKYYVKNRISSLRRKMQ